MPWRLQQCVLPTNRLRRHSIKPHFRACVRWVGSSTSAALPSSVRLPLRCAVSRRRRWRCGRFPGTIGRQDYSCRVDGAACVSALSRSTFRLYHTAIARNGYGSQRHYQPALVQCSLARWLRRGVIKFYSFSKPQQQHWHDFSIFSYPLLCFMFFINELTAACTVIFTLTLCHFSVLPGGV